MTTYYTNFRSFCWMIRTQSTLWFRLVRFPHCKPIPVMKTGFSLWSFSHREKPVFIAGVPCNENRFFSVWKNFAGKTLFSRCNDPVRDCSVSMICLTLLYFHYEMHIASDNQCADGQAQPYCKNWFDKQRKQEFPWPSGTLLYCTYKNRVQQKNSRKKQISCVAIKILSVFYSYKLFLNYISKALKSIIFWDR